MMESFAESAGTVSTATGFKSQRAYGKEGFYHQTCIVGIYVDDLISILQSSGVGCHVRKIFAAALFYADDMAVLAPSLKGLQRLINICRDYCSEWDILMNAKKSKNLYFGLQKPPPISLELGGVRIPWEDSWEYLGVTLRSGKVFDCCVKQRLAKF